MFNKIKTKDFQISLIGIIIILLSLIAIIDLKGYVGSILSFPFVFLFGDFYMLPLILIIISAILLIRNKKFKFNLSLFSLFFVFLTLMIYNSFNEWELKDVTPFYLNMFNSTLPPFFANFEFGILHGGYIGNTSFTFLNSIFGSRGINIFLLIIFIITILISIKPLINFFVNIFYNIDEKSIEKKKKQEVVFKDFEPVVKEKKVREYVAPTNVVVNDVFLDKKEEVIEERKSTLFMDLEFKKDKQIKEDKPKDFNIFDDDLSFDKKEEISSFNEVNLEEDDSLLKEKSFNENINVSSFEGRTSSLFEEVPPVQEEIKVDVTPIIRNNDTSITRDSFSNYYEEEKPIVKEEVKEEKKEEVKEEKKEEVKYNHPYKLPPLSLLNDIPNEDDSENRNEAEIKGVRLDQKLASLNINAKVVNFIVAPSFTRFEISVASDVKLNVFNNIKQDIMMALSAEKINILAPIPGTPYVGIEIPNVKRSAVSFKEVFKDIPFKDKDEKLLVVLGKDISGKTVTMKINDTPHLLIAGSTGSGKSVCINTIIASILMRASYDEVKLILVDPKRVEMAIYANIPHLLCPVINEPLKATVALNKICEIMDERYKLFSEADSVVRSIESYNKLMKEKGEKPLPYIVMIIDELSDLMLVAGKDVESSILRITQLARACGIHLIVATQRPSVDVITGIIKANLPSRIAFAVSTSADSRTILDQGGAEDLLGRGDSLVSMRGDLKMSRVQGAYVSDSEIEDIVNFVTKQRRPVYDPRFLNLEPKQEVVDCSVEGLSTDDDDEFYEMVLNYVKTLKTVSTTSLQVHFKMGYPKARRMIDLLEENGAISGPNGSKGRQVLVNNYD